MTASRTGHHVRHRDLLEQVKVMLTQVITCVPGLSVAGLSRALDEGESLMRARLDPSRDNQPPMAWLAHPAMPEVLRRLVLRGLDSIYYALRALAPGAQTAEVQTQVVLGTVGALLTATSEAMLDGRYDPAEARRVLPILSRLRGQVDNLTEQLTAVAAGSGEQPS